MSLQITGQQFVDNGEVRSYHVSGIPSGYSIDSTQFPNGWSIAFASAIVAGEQDFDLNVGIGSGTLVLIYGNGALSTTALLDVYSGATRMGEEITEDGVIFIPPAIPIPPIFCEDTSDCVFPLNVFADPDDISNFNNNDKSDFYFYGDASITNVVMTLQKFMSGGWVDVQLISDSSFGQFFEFGKSPNFSGDNFTDDFNKKYTGVFIEWIEVYTSFGIGRYRMKITETDIFSETTDYYSKSEYCLKKWNCHNTDGTIKIETLNVGLRGTLHNNTVQIDYGFETPLYRGWKGEIRLKGMFEQLDPAYNREYNQYGDASYNAFKPIIDEQIPKYKSDIKPVPGWIDWYLSTNVLQADQILITDYNSKGRHSLVRVPVKDGEIIIIPETKKYPYPLAAIELKLTYGQNNLRKRNS